MLSDHALATLKGKRDSAFAELMALDREYAEAVVRREGKGQDKGDGKGQDDGKGKDEGKGKGKDECKGKDEGKDNGNDDGKGKDEGN